MDKALKKDTYMNYQMLWSGSIGGETSAECIVPDSMPDVGTLVDAEATLSIRSKETESGRIRATTELNIKILYQPEEGGMLQSLPLSLSCDVSASVPEADTNCHSIVKLRVRNLDAKALNSRKISLHAELSGSAMCLCRQELSIVREIDCPGLSLETLEQSIENCVIADAKEKTFVLTEDYSLPAGCEAVDRILMQRVQLSVDGSDFISGKLVFRGRARVFLLLACGEELYPCSYESEFSQVMEAGGSGSPAPEISLMLTGAYFDLPEHSSGKITAELHILAQVVCSNVEEVNYIADLYSNQKALEPVMQESRFCTQARDITLVKSLSSSAELPPDAVSVLYAKAIPGSISAEETGIQISVSVKAIYKRSDGSSGSCSLRLKDVLQWDAQDGERLNILSVNTGDCYASVVGGRLEARVSVEVFARACSEISVSCVSDVQELESSLPEMPSVTLRRVDKSNDLWTLAKTYRSSRSAILAANGGREEGLLLIPKAR